jgi:hypothetical protein
VAGDYVAAAEAAQRLAEANLRWAEFNRLAHVTAASINPPPPRQLSKEEILAMPTERLTPELLRRPEFSTAPSLVFK